MAAPHRAWAAELLHFWFQKLGPAGWFGSRKQRGAELKRRFEPELLWLASRPAGEFLGGPQSALAAVLLFDQIPHNIYRGTSQAFVFDPPALAATRTAKRFWAGPVQMRNCAR